MSSNPSILLSGAGDLRKCNSPPNPPASDVPTLTTLAFQQKKKYLIRIINTSFGTSFLFTIDNHILKVVSVDFVPIVPYTTTQLYVAIGQRYNVIVEAIPSNNPKDLSDFWIRTYPLDSELVNTTAPHCNEIGYVRYNTSSSADPKSSPWNPNYINATFEDETMQSGVTITPWVPWFVGSQANPPMDAPEKHDVQRAGPASTDYPVAFFAIGEHMPSQTSASMPTPTPVPLMPFRVDWQNITFQNLGNTGSWPDPWVVVAENGTPQDWVCSLASFLL